MKNFIELDESKRDDGTGRLEVSRFNKSFAYINIASTRSFYGSLYKCTHKYIYINIIIYCILRLFNVC